VLYRHRRVPAREAPENAQERQKDAKKAALWGAASSRAANSQFELPDWPPHVDIAGAIREAIPQLCGPGLLGIRARD